MARARDRSRRKAWVAATLAVLAAPACVERLVKIQTEPEGVAVLVNGRPAGTTPLEYPFTHYGTYRVDLWKEGYQAWSGEIDVSAPWYQYFPFDFFAETLDPFRHQDVHEHFVKLEPHPAPGSLSEPDAAFQVLHEEAEALRAEVR